MKTIPSLCRRFFAMFRISSSLNGCSRLLLPWRHPLHCPGQPRSLKRNRSEPDYERFARFFAGQGIPEPILEETYRALVHKIALFPAFSIHPQDSLWHVYDLDCYRDDELADLMSIIRTACPLRFYKPIPTSLPCDTVAQLVYLLANQCDRMYPPQDRISPPDKWKAVSEKIIKFLG